MATQINQFESDGRVYFRVEGDMYLEDAELLEKLVREARFSGDILVTVDLADLTFLDSESASILRRMESEGLVEIQGIEFFLQSAIDIAERAA
ncbi:MAG: hypothetical protein KF762_03320 [Acidobacteria bacterium]|nr:hypothetical protein [Acidobacteriota bacterium]